MNTLENTTVSAPEADAILKIAQAVTCQHPALIEKFIHHMSREINKQPKKQESMKIFLLNLKNIVDEYIVDIDTAICIEEATNEIE